MSGSWYYCRNLHALPSVSLFPFGQFVFKVILSCIFPVLVRYYYSAASLVTTEALTAIKFFCP
jgi:hypothetical protein